MAAREVRVTSKFVSTTKYHVTFFSKDADIPNYYISREE